MLHPTPSHGSLQSYIGLLSRRAPLPCSGLLWDLLAEVAVSLSECGPSTNSSMSSSGTFVLSVRASSPCRAFLFNFFTLPLAGSMSTHTKIYEFRCIKLPAAVAEAPCRHTLDPRNPNQANHTLGSQVYLLTPLQLPRPI